MEPIRRSLCWGLAIGLVNLLWLYLSYYIGLHTNGIALFQVVPLGWFVLTIAGYIVAFRDLRRRQPLLGYWQGVGYGLLMAFASMCVAIVMQVGYFTVIHPQWPEYMAAETRAHFQSQGLPDAEVERLVEASRGYFTLRSYATQSAVLALALGAVLSLITMWFLRSKGGSREQSIPETSQA